MNTVRFVMERVLLTVRADVLGKFAACFQEDWAKRNLPCPVNGIAVAERNAAWTEMLTGADGPPEEMVDALLGVRELARPANAEQLRRWVAEGRAFPVDEEMAGEDVALRFWLWSRDAFREKASLVRVQSLMAFVYFVRNPDPASRGPARPEMNGSVEKLTEELDAAYKDELQVEDSAVVRPYKIGGEWLYPVRHGEAFRRVVGVKRRDVKIVGYWPLRDDLVVYSPKRDELRVNARSHREEELYRRKFGAFLKGQENYFERRPVYDLKPLREEGVEALRCRDVGDLDLVWLREIEWDTENATGAVWRVKAKDVVEALSLDDRELSEECKRIKPVRAVFELRRRGVRKSVRVEVRPPEGLKASPGADMALVQQWLVSRGFRVDVPKDLEVKE